MKKLLKILVPLLLFSTPLLAGSIWNVDPSGNLTINSGGSIELFSDAGITPKFKLFGATGNLGIFSGAKICLDGPLCSGDTYLYEISANNMRFVAGGVNALNLNTTQASIMTGLNFAIVAGQKLFLDGGTDDYWRNSANGQNDLTCAGSLCLRVTASGLQSPTVVTPTIANFTNATHSHQNAAGGGTLDAAAITSSVTGSGNVVKATSPTVSNMTSNSSFSLGSAGATFNLEPTANVAMLAPSTTQFSLFVGTLSLASTTTLTESFRSFLPGASSTYSLGSPSNTWNEVYLDPQDPPIAPNAGNSNSLVKAWGSVSILGARQSHYNISSTGTNGGTGLYRVTWDTDFASTSYSVSATSQTIGVSCSIAARTTAHADIECWSTISNADSNAAFDIVAYGAQ